MFPLIQLKGPFESLHWLALLLIAWMLLKSLSWLQATFYWVPQLSRRTLSLGKKLVFVLYFILRPWQCLVFVSCLIVSCLVVFYANGGQTGSPLGLILFSIGFFVRSVGDNCSPFCCLGMKPPVNCFIFCFIILSGRVLCCFWRFSEWVFQFFVADWIWKKFVSEYLY